MATGEKFWGEDGRKEVTGKDSRAEGGEKEMVLVLELVQELVQELEMGFEIQLGLEQELEKGDGEGKKATGKVLREKGGKKEMVLALELVQELEMVLEIQ